MAADDVSVETVRLLIAILGVLVCIGAAQRVEAQTLPDECEGLWQQAREARSAGNLVEARRFLEETMACSPSVSGAFNLAAVLRDMGRYSDAQHYLLGLLDGQFGELPAQRRGIVESELERIQHSLGTLEVTIEPAAELRLNGSAYGTFRGARVLALDPGEWSLELRAEGFRPRSEQISLRSGQRLRLRYELEPDNGEAALTTTQTDGARPSLLPRRLGIALAVVGVVALALTIGLVVRSNNQSVSDPFFGNPST